MKNQDKVIEQLWEIRDAIEMVNYRYKQLYDALDDSNLFGDKLAECKLQVGDYVSVDCSSSDSFVLSKIISLGIEEYTLLEVDSQTSISRVYCSLLELEDELSKTDSYVYHVKDTLEWVVGRKYLVYDNSGDSDFEVTIGYDNDKKSYTLLHGDGEETFYDECFYELEELIFKMTSDFNLIKQLRDIEEITKE